MRLSIALALLIASGTSLLTHGATASERPLDCEALAHLKVAHTTIATAELIAPGAFKSPAPGGFPPGDFSKLPAFCRVAGSIHPTGDSDIRFELWLPVTGWNGKFVQTGNGGAAGSIVYGSLADPLARGYAVANTDTGHQGGGGDFGWAVGHPEKMTDYAYRAVHELTITGKAITAQGYGRAPKQSYWVGCSTGGRQGLKEAQRFPRDYDAIVAGAPASNWSPLMATSILIQRNLGPGGLGLDKLSLLREAAIAQCDALDGVQDRVITATAQCRFDPAILQCQDGATQHCLSASEVDAAKRIYRGVVAQDGKVLMPGPGPGSELQWAAYASPQFGIGSNYFRNVIAHDPNWKPASFDIDRDLALAEQADGGAAAAMDPDLSTFIAHGGKLITYHGTTDGLIPYGNSVNYYNSVVAKLGAKKTHQGVRFYVVPGMDHCAGGEGAFAIDWLGALESWVEKGRLDTLPATHPAPPAAPPAGPPGAPPRPGKVFTRPQCAYPEVATYQGTGDTADAASFHCRVP